MEAKRIAFVCPRFADEGTVGGAETLLRKLAECAVAAGRAVRFLTTCARDHRTWANAVPPGPRREGPLDVTFFPVDDDRDARAFDRLQQAIGRGRRLGADEQAAWLRHNVNSRALYAYLQEHEQEFDRIVAGPYLFGTTLRAAEVCPRKTILVPCLHDEPFARLDPVRALFGRVAGCMFNAPPERDLARRLYGLDERRCRVVGMGLDPFEADPAAFAAHRRLRAPYVLYCGRREPMKGTPLLADYMTAFRARTGRDVKLVLTGSGAVEAPPSLREHLVDAGVVTEREKRDAMAGALVFCHPSVNESFGIVVLESWLAGAPVLAHAGSEVLRFQCARSRGGLWFRNYPEFEQELILLLDNEALRGALARAGRRYVLNEYSWATIRARLLDALDTL